RAEDLEDGVDGGEVEAPEHGGQEGTDHRQEEPGPVFPGEAEGPQEVLHALIPRGSELAGPAAHRPGVVTHRGPANKPETGAVVSSRELSVKDKEASPFAPVW